MKGGMLTTALVAAFLILTLITVASVRYVSANFSPVLPADNVVIEADGSVGGTNKIVRNGDVYTFIGNVSGTQTLQGSSSGNMSSALAIHKSNIVIDGAGYTLQGNGGKAGIDISNGVCKKPSEREVWNVTIKNLRVTNCSCGIHCEFGGNHTFYGDYISNDFISGDAGSNSSWESLGIALWGSSGVNISHCTIGGSPAVYMHFVCSNNIVTENNIVAGVSIAISGIETFDRNYWGDYLTRYPNATETDSSGVGNMPYAFADTQMDRRTFQDNHPLINPLAIPYFSSSLPTIVPYQEPEGFPTVLVVAAVVTVMAVAVAVGIIVYFKRRK